MAPAYLNGTVQLLAHSWGQTFIDLAQQLQGQRALSIRQLSGIWLQPQTGACRKAEEEQKAGKESNNLPAPMARNPRSEEHTSELQSRQHLVCRLLLAKKNIS